MSNASEYADMVSRQIAEDTENGHPYGLSEGYGDTPEDEPNSAIDWLSEVLDIEYLVSSDMTYKAARILVAFGGPNAWIDTRTEKLEVYWGSATEYRNLPSEFVAGLDEVLEDIYASR